MLQSSKNSNASLLAFASSLSDEEWLNMMIRSVQNPIVDGIELPGFPSEEFQRNTVGSVGVNAISYEAYNFYRLIKQYASQLGIALNRGTTLLDFGCGWGRMIRFFLKDIASENLYGIDVDPIMVDTCNQTVRYGNYSVVKPLPPTQFADNSFDIICAYSVFSHLAEPAHIQWIEEFSRILKPGGILLATTQARRFLEFCRALQGQKHDSLWHQYLAKSFLDIDAAYAKYDAGQFLYSATGGGSVRDASFYGEALIPQQYVEREWTKYLQFRDFMDVPEMLPQSLIVMQKAQSIRSVSENKKQSSNSSIEKDYQSGKDSLLQPDKNDLKSLNQNSKQLDEEIIERALDINCWLTQAELTRNSATLVGGSATKDKSSATLPLSKLFRKVETKLLGKATFEIKDITYFCLEDSEHFWGGWLDFPRKGDVFEGYGLYLSGWVIGKKKPGVTMQLLFDENLIGEIAINVPRPDVRNAYTFLQQGSDLFGYAGSVNLEVLPNEGKLRLVCVFTDNSSVPMGLVEYCKY